MALSETRWEYKVVFPELNGIEFVTTFSTWQESLANFLNEHGKDGWELADFQLNVEGRWFHAIFKRPVEYVTETLG